MAELTPPVQDETGTFFDSDQVWNFIRGLVTAKHGMEQAFAEAGEAIGVHEAGFAQYLTQQLNKEQGIMKEATGAASELDGSSIVELLGEVAPAVMVPFGGSVKAATGLGAAASSAFYHEDLDQSRMADMALGALGGGLFKSASNSIRGLFKGPAQQDLRQSVGTDLVPVDQVKTGLSVPRPPRSSAGDPFRPYQPSNRILGPPDDFIDFVKGRDYVDLSSTRVKIKDPSRALPPPSANRGMHRPTEPMVMRGRPAKYKEKNNTNAAHRGMAHRALEKLTEKEAQISKMYKALQQAGGDFSKIEKATGKVNKEALQKLAEWQNKLNSEEVIAKVLRHEIEQVSGIGQALRDAAIKADKATPTTGVSKAQSPRTEALNGSQGGFIGNELVNTLGGAAVGGTLGLAVGEDPMAGVAGAIAGGVASRALGRRLNNASSFEEKKAMRDASRKGEVYQSDVSKFQKAKNIGKEQIADLVQSGKNVLDSFLGATITRLEGLSPRVAVAMRQMEFNVHQKSGEWMTEGEPFFAALDKSGLSDQDRDKFNILLLNSREKAANFLKAKGETELLDKLQDMSALLDDVGVYLGQVGLGQNLRKSYFPRQVVDITPFTKIEEVDNYLKYLAKKKGVTLTDFDKEQAITDLINNAVSKGNESTEFARAATNLKKRSHKVTDESIDAYAGLQEGFNNYIENITRQVERRKFFQGLDVDVDDLGPQGENLSGVAIKLKDQLKDGDLTPEQLDEVAQLIRMRFGPGEQASSRAVQNFKNLTYTGLLGNPIAAMTQAGDLALSAYKNGIANTASSAIKIIGNKNNPLSNGVDKEGLLGIRDAAEDFASKVGTRDVLNWSFKYSGFRGMDRLGKNTFINAALKKNQQIPKDDFYQKWQKTFDPDGGTKNTDALYEHVQSFKKVDDTNKDTVGFMLWNELSDVQPIGLSSLPEKYLKHPNGRVGYMLQTFTLKLFDVMRKDILQNVAKRNYKEATANAAKLSSLFVMMNGSVDSGKNFLLGRDEALTDTMLNNYLKMLGANKYMTSSIARDGIGSTLVDTVAPPTVLLDGLTDPKKALQMMPPLGRLIGE